MRKPRYSARRDQSLLMIRRSRSIESAVTTLRRHRSGRHTRARAVSPGPAIAGRLLIQRPRRTASCPQRIPSSRSPFWPSNRPANALPHVSCSPVQRFLVDRDQPHPLERDTQKLKIHRATQRSAPRMGLLSGRFKYRSQPAPPPRDRLSWRWRFRSHPGSRAAIPQSEP